MIAMVVVAASMKIIAITVEVVHVSVEVLVIINNISSEIVQETDDYS